MKKLGTSWILGGLAGALFLGVCQVAQAGDDRLALKGYDPVAYFTEKRAVAGTSHYRHDWDGAIYQFVSAKHLELFKTDPDRYLPQYENWCAASVANGAKVHANPEFWLVVDGRLYLFGGPIGPTLMSKDTTAMKSQADDNWPKVSKLPDPPRQ
jgi:YHS domain-containing protein